MITLTTDFGVDSPYVAQMKAAILTIAPEVMIVDVTHSIGPQNVMEGAIVLTDTAFHFPAGAIHVAVVDPGVGTDRAIVAAHIEGQWFVAPDNGLLTGVAAGREIAELRTVFNPQLWRQTVSSTFHGRDMMAPVAAHLSRGIAAEELGPPRDGFERLDWPIACQEADRVTGKVIYIDSFGNLMTNLTREQVQPMLNRGDVHIYCGERSIQGVSATYGENAAGQLVALFGSSDRLELAVVGTNAAKATGIAVGETVVVVRK
jgi:S-adenosyl-L-methionine hydrolase (adenosine-forming)